jgi:hypothetical protein
MIIFKKCQKQGLGIDEYDSASEAIILSCLRYILNTLRTSYINRMTDKINAIFRKTYEWHLAKKESL